MTQTVLLAGATGMLGSQIAHQLLNQSEARLRLLVRGGTCAPRWLTGQTALSDLQNDRYPDLKLESFAQFAARTLPSRAAA